MGLLVRAVLDARAAQGEAAQADLAVPDWCRRTSAGRIKRSTARWGRIYRGSGFAFERERVEHLFLLHEKMYTPLATGQKRHSRRSKRKHAPGAPGTAGSKGRPGMANRAYPVRTDSYYM